MYSSVSMKPVFAGACSGWAWVTLSKRGAATPALASPQARSFSGLFRPTSSASAGTIGRSCGANCYWISVNRPCRASSTRARAAAVTCEVFMGSLPLMLVVCRFIRL